MEKIFIDSFADKQTVQTTFLTKNKTLLTDKKGNSYLSLVLADKTGVIDGKVWDNVEQINNSFEAGDIVEVKGLVQTYQSKKQLIVHKVLVHDAESVVFADYVGETHRSPAENLAEVIQISQDIQSEPLRQLVLSTLNDPQIKEKLLTSPAAKTIHHAQVGGLIEHILSICKLMQFIGGHYSHLNTDFLIFGAIFHDIGKIWELEWTPKGIRYTDKGRLVGHLVMSAELVERKAAQIMAFPEELKMVLKHIVLAHHGKLEYGSPKVPMILEAYIVWMVDDLDSKVDSITQFSKQDPSNTSPWTSFSQLYGRHFFTKDFKEPLS